MRIFYSLLVFALFLTGCASPEPVLEPISYEPPKASPERASSQPDQIVEVLEPQGELIVPTLQRYYLEAQNPTKEFERTKSRLNELIEGKKGDLNYPDSNSVSPLQVAVQHNDKEMITRLVNAGANTSQLSSFKIPLITLALQEGTLESAKALLASGADSNVGDNQVPSPLTIAVLGGITSEEYGKMAIVLLESGANPNYGSIGENSLLLYAIKTAQNQVAISMIENGANIDTVDENGQNALSWAVVMRANSVTDALLEKKALGNERDAYGYTPLAWAVFVDNQHAIDRLKGEEFSQNESDRGWMGAQIAKNHTLNELRAMLVGASLPISGENSIIKFKDMDFVSIEYSKDAILIRTNDPLIKHFELKNPNRIVLDLKRAAGVKNINLKIDEAPLKQVAIGRHLGQYRVVLQLDQAHKYSIDQGIGLIKVNLK